MASKKVAKKPARKGHKRGSKLTAKQAAKLARQDAKEAARRSSRKRSRHGARKESKKPVHKSGRKSDRGRSKSKSGKKAPCHKCAKKASRSSSDESHSESDSRTKSDSDSTRTSISTKETEKSRGTTESTESEDPHEKKQPRLSTASKKEQTTFSRKPSMSRRDLIKDSQVEINDYVDRQSVIITRASTPMAEEDKKKLEGRIAALERQRDQLENELMECSKLRIETLRETERILQAEVTKPATKARVPSDKRSKQLEQTDPDVQKYHNEQKIKCLNTKTVNDALVLMLRLMCKKRVKDTPNITKHVSNLPHVCCVPVSPTVDIGDDCCSSFDDHITLC
ncbi:hypothetical protein Ciccas_004082 [Cichlidogyrus casuarinus]|uniref:Uncharacterized protein n=1 Tax=Cichlidogyrus casuarinus TaxID=1844966 RepID=A0ABD2QCJ3_9PLAT